MKKSDIKKSNHFTNFQCLNVWISTYDKIRKALAYLTLKEQNESIAEFIDKAVNERIERLI